jgi:hypothetical protein
MRHRLPPAPAARAHGTDYHSPVPRPADDRPAPRPRRPLTPGRLLAFTALTLLLFLGLLEGALQVLAATQGPQHRLPEDGSVAAPDPAAFRVIAVGDSWVYGAESEPDEAFIEVFRRAAAERLGKPVQVYNLGVSASNSSQALVSLARVLEPVQPDLVVALTGANNRLHDRDVLEAARILGEDARTVPGLSAIAGLRTVRLARLLWVNLVAPDHIDATAAAASTGAATAPPPRAPTLVRLPWWDLFVARRWDDALLVLRDTTPPGDAPALRGLQRAWEALLLARTGALDEAEAAATDALRLGGDDVAAHEARAVVAERQGRGLDALHHRARAAQAQGNPYLAQLARGRVLLELEAWEAARDWLLGVATAVPGQLEALLALAQLPPTVRTEQVDQLLFDGPRGLVTPVEYMRWHLASSGRLDRAIGSLDTEEPDEPLDVALARAEGRALSGEPGAADAALALLPRAATARDRDEVLGAAYRLGADPVDHPDLRATDDLVGPFTQLGLLVAHGRAGRCEESVRAAQRALDLGALPSAIERLAGPCLPRDTSWTLSEMVFEREAPFDRDRLITGGPVATAVPAPSLALWPAFRARRFEALPPETPPEWRGLARAFDDAVDDPLLDALAAGEPVEDPAVAALAVGYGLLREGKQRGALDWLARAAASDVGEPWARALARGVGAALARDWGDAQRSLHLAESAAPRQLESLEALTWVPPARRSLATREAVDRAPVGSVTGARWGEWYLDRGQEARAALAVRWSWARAGELGAARLALVEAQLTESKDRAAAVALADGVLGDLEETHPEQTELRCRAAELRFGLGQRGQEPPPSRPRCRAEPSRSSAPSNELASRWLARLDDPDADDEAAAGQETRILVRQLDGMRRLAESQGAAFVALTYPFPSGHHAEVREVVMGGAATRGYQVLDLYGAFEAAFSQPEWEALRTPEDHVNARGYALMGELLTDWAAREGLLPATPGG